MDLKKEQKKKEQGKKATRTKKKDKDVQNSLNAIVDITVNLFHPFQKGYLDYEILVFGVK